MLVFMHTRYCEVVITATKIQQTEGIITKRENKCLENHHFRYYLDIQYLIKLYE